MSQFATIVDSSTPIAPEMFRLLVTAAALGGVLGTPAYR